MDIFPYDAVVFDLDGTLFDAEEGIVSSVRRAMDEMGLEVPADADLREVVGPPLADSFRDLLGVPEVMIRDEKGQFLDDITLEELGRTLGCRAISIPTDGGGCCKAMLTSHKRKTIKFKR